MRASYLFILFSLLIVLSSINLSMDHVISQEEMSYPQQINYSADLELEETYTWNGLRGASRSEVFYIVEIKVLSENRTVDANRTNPLFSVTTLEDNEVTDQQIGNDPSFLIIPINYVLTNGSSGNIVAYTENYFEQNYDPYVGDNILTLNYSTAAVFEEFVYDVGTGLLLHYDYFEHDEHLQEIDLVTIISSSEDSMISTNTSETTWTHSVMMISGLGVIIIGIKRD